MNDADESQAKSLARVQNLRPLPALYRCRCGLLRFSPGPCAECDSAAVRYLSGLRDVQRARTR